MNITNSSIPSQMYTGIIFSWPNYIKISLSLFGMLTNIVNILIFTSSRLKETSYKFMFAKSTANLLYLIISFLNEFLVICVNCMSNLNYASAVYSIAINFYLYTTLSFFRTILDLMIVVHTYCILKNKHWTTKIAYHWYLLIIGIIAFVYHSYKPFMYWIYQVPNGSKTNLYATSFGSSNTSKLLLMVQAFIKIFLTSLLYPFISLTNLYHFRRRFGNRILSLGNSSISLSKDINFTELKILKDFFMIFVFFKDQSNTSLSLSQFSINSRKISRTGDLEKSKNPILQKFIVRMVIFSSFMNILTQMPFSFCIILNFAGVNSPTFKTFQTSSSFLVILSPGCDFLLYYAYNKLFRSVFNDSIKQIFR